MMTNHKRLCSLADSSHAYAVRVGATSVNEFIHYRRQFFPPVLSCIPRSQVRGTARAGEWVQQRARFSRSLSGAHRALHERWQCHRDNFSLPSFSVSSFFFFLTCTCNPTLLMQLGSGHVIVPTCASGPFPQITQSAGTRSKFRTPFDVCVILIPAIHIVTVIHLILKLGSP